MAPRAIKYRDTISGPRNIQAIENQAPGEQLSVMELHTPAPYLHLSNASGHGALATGSDPVQQRSLTAQKPWTLAVSSFRVLDLAIST